MMRALVLLLFVPILAACGNNRPAVERQSFLIQVERTGAAAHPVTGVLRIGKVVVASPFDERPLVYRRDDVRYEADFYNQFAADPPDMLAEAVAGWLRQSGLFRRIVPPGGVAPADYRLEANVSALYVDFREDPAAVMNLRWQVVRESDGSTVVEQESRQRVAITETSPAGAVRALRQAVQQALGGLEAALAASRF